MRVALTTSATLLMLVLAGCGEPRQVGDIYVQGSVTSYNYYAELHVKQDSGKERIYLLFDPKTVESFDGGGREMPMSKTLIAAGPEKATMVIEQVKDPAQSLIITRRLLTTFNDRNKASVKTP